jgi:dienelactone hydrolase
MNRASLLIRSLVLGLAPLAPAAAVQAQAQEAQGQPAPSFVRETVAGLPGYNVYSPADLARRARPAPVVVWANGGCVKRDATWASLFERWAGAGYVVVTIHDADSPTTMAAMAEQQAAARAAAQADPENPEVRARMRAGAGIQAKAATEAQRQAIDWAFRANAEPGKWRGRIDTSRVVAAGNSCGGISSLNLAASEPRVGSVFVLSGSSIGPGASIEAVQPVMSKVSVPAIWIVGGPEDVARAASEMDYSLQPVGKPGVIVYRKSFDHRTVSTDPATLREVAEMGLNWFRATLFGDHKAATELTTTVCAACSAEIWTVKAKHIGTAQ